MKKKEKKSQVSSVELRIIRYIYHGTNLYRQPTYIFLIKCIKTTFDPIYEMMPKTHKYVNLCLN